jgi:hypothetical protein
LELRPVPRAGDEAVGMVMGQTHYGIGYRGLGPLGPPKAQAHP